MGKGVLIVRSLDVTPLDFFCKSLLCGIRVNDLPGLHQQEKNCCQTIQTKSELKTTITDFL